MSELTQFIQNLPKAEVHVHLEGTVTPETLKELARRHQVDLSAATPIGSRTIHNPAAVRRYLDGQPKFHDFNEFIALYLKICECIRTADDLELVGKAYLSAAVTEGIQKIEAYFSPSTFIRLFRRNESELFEGLRRIEKFGRDSGIRCGWIFDVVRNTSETGFEVLELIHLARRQGTNVIALGLAGDETIGTPEQFVDVFENARREGLKTIAHTGELCGPNEIRRTIELLRPDRIGHGVQMFSSPELIRYCVERKVPVEVSPWSNIQLGLFTEENHPLQQLYREGVFLTVASDDPGVFGRSLTQAYEYAHQQGLSEHDLIRLAENSQEMSLVD